MVLRFTVDTRWTYIANPSDAILGDRKELKFFEMGRSNLDDTRTGLEVRKSNKVAPVKVHVSRNVVVNRDRSLKARVGLRFFLFELAQFLVGRPSSA